MDTPSRTDENPRLYREFADWFHLLSDPLDYHEEAAFAHELLSRVSPQPITLLELGSGGGNNAFHLKRHYRMTLSDLSPDMLRLSGRINPDCEHVCGDMRNLDLQRRFDAVFVHDAIMYMTNVDDLRAAIHTAAMHCKPGGPVLIMPDCVRETLRSGVHHHGGHDEDGRGLRYLEWTFDPEPHDTTYTIDFVYLLREGNAPVEVVHDRHLHGVFARQRWLELLAGESLAAEVVADPWGREVFLAVRT